MTDEGGALDGAGESRRLHFALDPRKIGMAGETVWCEVLGRAPDGQELGADEQLVRVDNVPFFAETATFNDTVVARVEEPAADGERWVLLEFRRVAAAGSWRGVSLLLVEAFDHAALRTLLDRLSEEHGVAAEVGFGGILALALPPGADEDAVARALSESRLTAGEET